MQLLPLVYSWPRCFVVKWLIQRSDYHVHPLTMTVALDRNLQLIISVVKLLGRFFLIEWILECHEWQWKETNKHEKNLAAETETLHKSFKELCHIYYTVLILVLFCLKKPNRSELGLRYFIVRPQKPSIAQCSRTSRDFRHWLNFKQKHKPQS